MKHLLIAACTWLCVPAVFAQQKIKHVVLITIDGFRPDFYLEPGWNTPHLRAMMQEGTHAKGVNSVFPSMTYPSHTAIVTGVQPATHGIYYNDLYDETGKGKGNYWKDSSIQVPTLWSVLHNRGMKVASLYWPVSAGAPVDYNIPDIGGRGEAVRDAYTKPAGFIETVKKDVFNGDKVSAGKDQNTARIAAWIIEKDAPAYMNMHLFSVDHAEHVQGRNGEMVKEAIADVDEAVAIVREALVKKGIWDSSMLIVTGDHGFVDVHTTVNPNAWLKQAGLLNDREHGDWKAQFYYSGGSAWLYLKQPGDHKTLNAVKKILANLPDSSKRYIRMIDRKQLDKAKANPEVALALTAEQNAAFGGKPEEAAVKPGKGGTHGYFPDFREIRTGFLVVAPGVKAGGVIQEMNLRDIAPIVARALQISFPTAEGKVPDGLFE